MLICADVFIGEAKSLWNKVKGKELSVCPCRPESGCAYQCQNRIMWYECNDSNCCVGRDKCTNRQFAQLQERLAEGRTASAKKFGVGVEPFKTQDRGFGLRANRSFEPGQIIVEYTGEIITKQEANNRTHTKKDDEVSSAPYLCPRCLAKSLVVSLSHGFPSGHATGRYSRQHCPLRKPFMLPQLLHRKMDSTRCSPYGSFCR